MGTETTAEHDDARPADVGGSPGAGDAPDAQGTATAGVSGQAEGSADAASPPAPAPADAAPRSPSLRARFLARVRNAYAFWVVGNWAVQLALAVFGVMAIFDDGLWWMQLWCIAGTAYAALAAVVLGLRARWPGRSSEPTSRLWLGWWRVPVAWFFTLVPAAIGVVVALQIIVVNKGLASDDTWELKVLGVWSMFLGWVFMHWGMAQIYQLRTEHARPGKVLDFPQTPRPGLVDHVYFSFTMGTTFAASDVTVVDTRMRWLVTVHSVVSFAMNALVIALAFSTIMNGGK